MRTASTTRAQPKATVAQPRLSQQMDTSFPHSQPPQTDHTFNTERTTRLCTASYSSGPRLPQEHVCLRSSLCFSSSCSYSCFGETTWGFRCNSPSLASRLIPAICPSRRIIISLAVQCSSALLHPHPPIHPYCVHWL